MTGTKQVHMMDSIIQEGGEIKDFVKSSFVYKQSSVLIFLVFAEMWLMTIRTLLPLLCFSTASTCFLALSSLA